MSRRRTAALVAVVVVMLAHTAAAAPPRALELPEAGVAFTPPAGWNEAPALARSVAKGFTQEAALAGAPGQKLKLGGRAWTSPADAAQRGVLHVQWIVASSATAAAAVPALVRAELDDARDRPRLTTLPRGAFELVSWREKVEGTRAWGELEYRHVANETRTLARTSLFVDAGGHLHEIRVECIMNDGASSLSAGDPLAPRTGCEAAMAGVVALAPTQLVALGDVPGQGSLRVTGDQLVDEEPPARADGGLELHTPVPGAKTPPALGPGGLGVPPRPAEARNFSRLLLVSGATILLLAVAFTMGRRRKSE